MIELLDSDEEAPPLPAARPEAAPCAPRPKGLRRVQHYAVGRLAREKDGALRARYFEAWWARALAGRPGRLAARAEGLEAANRVPLLKPYYVLWGRAGEVKREAAERCKAEGNGAFKLGNFDAAIAHYTEAIDMAPANAAERAVYFANRAACYAKREDWRAVEKDCTQALRVNPTYEKALNRRMVACSELGDDDYYKALEDAEALLKLQPHNAQARATAARLGPVVEQRKKEQMEEAMKGLKNMGNSLLGYFGLSLDNFKTTQNPDGTYGVQFEQ
eukprot:TRINITY_DN12206_c0_g1_i1.p1 TRINITY_DN12206_c0_g1~~TRINITY_DN12206_c0_g1_i1.p1  ORF type:complete len:275 (+),score=110.48 TRINITY_DN12206_c0_g1_i1:76-900(+)